MHSLSSELVRPSAITLDRRAYPTYDRWAIVIEVSAWVLAISASMILGLLSFSGMLAIWPVLPLAFAAFLFAIVIEGQIYLDNMRSSLEKLSDPKAYEHQLSALYLQEKLVNYDKNRDLFILNEPTEDNIRRVREHNEVVVFKKDRHYAIGFRNLNGEYEQRDLVDAEQNKFLAHYSQKEQFMEIPGHHDLIQNILRSFDGQISDRPQEQYPVLVHAYVSQCRYLRKLNCYLHTQVENEASQNDLKNMNLHLTKLSEDMSEYLFHDVSRDETAAHIPFDLWNTGKKYSLDLETMTVAADAVVAKSKSRSKTYFSAFNSSTFNKELRTPALLELKVAIEDNLSSEEATSLSVQTIEELEQQLKFARSQLIVFSEEEAHRRNERKSVLEPMLCDAREVRSAENKDGYKENKELDKSIELMRTELDDLLQATVSRRISRLEQHISDRTAKEDRERTKLALVAMLGEKTYEYHRNKLIEWIAPDKADWEKRLTKHTINSRIAFVIAAFSGLIMGIGTTYLIMEAVAVIPWLMILPLSLFPPVIGPLALIAGAAYGLLIYNSLTDILLDNPAKKFIDRIRAISTQEMTFKRVLILSLSLVLFLVTIFLTMCTAGTWLTVFHKTKPLFTWISVIPNVLLNIIIPILIGISVLPFSFQSVSNTLEGLEANPSLDRAINALNPRNWRAPTGRLPHTWAEASEWLSERMWQHWVPDFLGITAAEFALETDMQKKNPYRIMYRLFFEPLRNFIFIGHLVSAGATSDQIEGHVWLSFWLNFWFECVEDWDWIWGRAHVDDIDTVDLLKERAQKTDDHNHDKNLPMRLLKFVFEPILQRAAQWDNKYRNVARRDVDNVQKRYEKIQGLQPEKPAPVIPAYRKGADFNLFLFKSSMYESSASLRDDCCAPKRAM
ncbi:MAG: hypothetical protein KBB94_03895 [Legionellaceae bacterium]|nr:hypothetical protein [Legionellaceae bacterium]MBP9774218.1 hypothetical protein [Legionellaceae bacterium]